MALTEQKVLDKIEIVNLGADYPAINIRSAIIISRDDVEIDRIFHRRVLMPDADLSNEDSDVVTIASTVFTDEAKEAYATRPQEAD